MTFGLAGPLNAGWSTHGMSADERLASPWSAQRNNTVSIGWSSRYALSGELRYLRVTFGSQGVIIRV